MKLGDIMSYANLSSYAETALVIFVVVYAVVALATLFRRDRRELERAAAMPLYDGTTADSSVGNPKS